MPIDGCHGPVIKAVPNWEFWLNSLLANILGWIFTKLHKMIGHGSVTVPIDGRQGPLIFVEIDRGVCGMSRKLFY